MKKRLIASVLTLVMAMTPIVGVPAVSYGSSDTCDFVTGRTPINEGAAIADNDITIHNDKIAASFAVGTNNYWNMTKGSILDIGTKNEDGTWSQSRVNDVEFLADLWTATGSYNGENLLTDVKVTPEKINDGVQVTSEYRYWVEDPTKDNQKLDAKPLDIKQVYTLMKGDNFISMKTTVTNPNENIDYKNMYSGYSISTKAANMFGPYGYYPDIKATGIAVGDSVDEYFGKYVATYDSDYAVSLHMDGTNAYKGSSGYKDVYKNQDLKAGETYTFDGEILVEGEDSTASVIDRWIERENIASSDYSTVSGKVTDKNGKAVEGVKVIVKKDGKYKPTKKSGPVNGVAVDEVKTIEQPFVWDTTDADGKYSVTLPNTGNSFDPNGKYEYKLKLEGAGYTSQTTDLFQLTKDETKDFTIDSGAQVKLTAVDNKGNAIPIRVEVSGVTYENKCAGVSTFFSDSIKKDKSVQFNLTQAKDVTFTASYGKDFESKTVDFKTDVTAEGVNHEFVIDEIVNPEESGWYTMDNHQHSNYGDGATSPAELTNAQIAAKLDYNLVSDHDSRINNKEMAGYAKDIGRNFIPSLEVSPGWGHWGMLNVDYSDPDNIVDPSTATPTEIINEGHKKGAVVVVNHPYSDYGFFNNQAGVKGGHADGWDNFDLLELQSTVSSAGATLDVLQKLTKEDYEHISLDNLNKTILEVADGEVKQMDAMALVSAFKFWNEGKDKYLSAGSDQHQATSTTLYPGIIREYAKVGDNASTEEYLKALTSGKAYVTMGPLMFPDDEHMFGSKVDINTVEDTNISIDLQAVNGLKNVVLYENGVATDSKDLGGATGRQKVDFKLKAELGTTWYSFVAMDKNGNYAVSNPVWVDTSDYSVANAEEAVAAAEEAVKTATDEITKAQAAVDQAQATADQAKADYDTVMSNAGATEEEKAAAQEALDNANAELAKAQNQLAAANDALTAAQEKVEICQKALDDAKLIKKLTDQLNDAKDQLNKTEDQLKDAQDKISELEKVDISNYAVSFDKANGEYVYTGSEIKPVVSVKGLTEGDFTVEFKDNLNAGTATVIITAASDKYKGSIEQTFTILKKPSTLTVKAKNKTVKKKTVKKKKVTVSALSVSKATGKVTYKKVSGSKKLKVTSAGKITVAKKTKKGTYKISVKVTDAGSANVKSASKTVTVKVKVK